MAQRVRDYDWAASELGDPSTWPENLRTSLSLCLTSRFPIVMWWGPDMLMFYNDAYIPFLGETKHPRALGRPGSECWQEIWDEIGPMLEGVYASGEATWTYEGQYFFDRRLPREEIFVTFTYGPILSADGVTVQGVFCPCTDTTDKIISARRLDTLRKLSDRQSPAGGVEAAAAHICRVLSGCLEDVAFASIYRIDSGDHSLLACTGLSPESAKSERWPLAETASLGLPLTVDLKQRGLEMPGGAWPEHADYARLIPLAWSPDGAITGILTLGVSPRRPLDAAYLDFFDLVASHSTSAIGSAVAYAYETTRAEALAELDRAKNAFFSNVSHEFRTPLTLMLGPLEDALDHPHQAIETKQIQMLHRNALRLQMLVNALLDFSRLEAGHMQACYEPHDLGRLTAEHAGTFRSAIEAGGLQLKVDCDPVEVYVAPDLYEKIVLNLLSNAFKYTLEGEIEVSLRERGNYVQLVVRDTGVGISESDHERIFERFHRVEGVSSRTHEGTGIGLALVRELVKLHGGQISIASEPGVGSTFTVTLPKGHVHLPAAQVNRAARHSVRGDISAPYTLEAVRWLTEQAPPITVREARRGQPIVLFADDNADMRDYVGRLLSSRYDVRLAVDGASALASVKESAPDIVISDVMMPGLNGLSLLHALRSDEATRSIPVILLSAKAGEGSRVDGMEAGADDYIVKPFSARELVARVGAHLRLSQLRQETLRMLRANDERLRTIIEQLPVGLGVSDITGRWVISNSMMETFSAHGMPSTVARAIPRWKAWDDNNEEVPPRDWPGARALRGETVPDGLEMHHLSEEGREYWLRVSATPLRAQNGRPIGACAVVQDITQLKQAEQDLREAHRRKDEFLATLAHELRNPLAPMHNGLYLLKQGTTPQEFDRLHDMLRRQLSHMHRLVDDLLEIARINIGKISLQKVPVDIADVVRHALDTSRAQIDSGRHRLEVDLPPEPIILEADPVRLAQVLSNVLNNAAKYTANGGRIRLHARREGREVVISVADNGIGIEADKLSTVFDLFTQLNGQSGQGGLGIGLTLVRNLVELHGGRIAVQSGGLGAGSEFVLRLPMPDVPLAVAPPPAQTLQPQALGRILVVDDNRDAAQTTASVLQLMGADVAVAGDGPTALQQLGSFNPDVIMLDIGMPGMDGYEVARRVRAGGHTVVLIAMTGWGHDDDRRRSQAAGFDHHLVKPMNFDALEELLTSLAEQRVAQ